MAKDLQGRRHDLDEMGQGNPAVSSGDEYSVTHTRKVEWPTPEAGERTIYRLTGSDSLLKIIVRNINGGRK